MQAIWIVWLTPCKPIFWPTLVLAGTKKAAFNVHGSMHRNILIYRCIKMIGAVWKLIIFTSVVKRLINTSRNERVTLQVWYMPTNVSFLRTAKKRLSHSFHTFFWHTRPSCTFSFTKAPRCLKLLIPASNAIGRWRITVELSPKCQVNRNNWSCFTNCSTQNAFCSGVAIIASLRHGPREKRGVGLRMRTKLMNTRRFFPCGKLTSACVLKAVMADWNRSNHFDTPCIVT